MNPQAKPSPVWSPRTWWGVVLGLLGLQLGLLWAVGGRQPIAPRPAKTAPRLAFAAPAAAEWLELQDPTLFVHGHGHSFAGAGWMQAPRLVYEAPEPVEAPRWLTLDAQALGGTLRQHIQANAARARLWLSRPDAPLATPDAAIMPATAAASALWVGGDLAGRPLRSPLPPLPAWDHTDLLTNSVVRVLVDASGQVVSHVLLAASGRAEADALALAVARSARFQPLPEGTSQSLDTLSPGVLVFEWQTLPLPPTNAPTAQP